MVHGRVDFIAHCDIYRYRRKYSERTLGRNRDITDEIAKILSDENFRIPAKWRNYSVAIFGYSKIPNGIHHTSE